MLSETDETSGLRAFVSDNQEQATRQLVPGEAVDAEGLIRLDVTVTDDHGAAVSGLSYSDFTLFDNGQPRKIVAFRAAGPGYTKIDPVTVILLIDTLELKPEFATLERQNVAEVLRQNSGHLAEPVTVYSLEDAGFFLTTKPSTDGNAQAEDVLADTRASVLVPRGTAFAQSPFIAALNALGSVSVMQDRNPGRKLLLWIGPGLGVFRTKIDPELPADFDPHGRSPAPTSGRLREAENQNVFSKICWFSILLRQARMSIDVLSVRDKSDKAMKQTSPEDAWKSFVVGVPSPHLASWIDLYKNVLAAQSGGSVLPPSNDIKQQIHDCIRDAGVFYTMTFDPPLAANPNEYHDLKVEVRQQPALTIRTSAGYYDQPYYRNRPDPTIRRVTAEQLAQILQAAPRASEAMRQLSALALTERLSPGGLNALSGHYHDRKVRERLEMIADQSAFLEPPASEIPNEPAPNLASQQRILAAAADYLRETIPRLPDIFATRTETNYRKTGGYQLPNSEVAPVPPHLEEQTKSPILYRHGSEVTQTAPRSASTDEDSEPKVFGTFGPILTVLQNALKVPTSVSWIRWEQDASGRRAVFRFAVSGSPTISMKGCCPPDSGEETYTRYAPDYKVEIAIDPESGAIMGTKLEFDLGYFVPRSSSAIMVSYGQVEIGGKSYIVPQRSVSISKGRTVIALSEMNLDFRTWGPYTTQMTVFTFDKYHVFRSEAHILPGFAPSP